MNPEPVLIPLPADAQALLDAANAIFPNRYAQAPTHPGKYLIMDTRYQRTAGHSPDALTAARNTLRSARLSLNNGNRKADAAQPHKHTTSVTLKVTTLQAFADEAHALGIPVTDLFDRLAAHLKATRPAKDNA